MIYPRINRYAQRESKGMGRIFDQYDIPTVITDLDSLFLTHFLKKQNLTVRIPGEKIANTDRELHHLCHISMIATHGGFFLPGHTGTFSFAHARPDLDRLLAATESFAGKLKETR